MTEQSSLVVREGTQIVGVKMCHALSKCVHIVRRNDVLATRSRHFRTGGEFSINSFACILLFFAGEL